MNQQDQDPAMDQTSGATTTSGASSGRSTTDAIKDAASQMTDKAQQVVGQATDQAKQQTVSQLAMRKDQAASSLNDVSRAVDQVGSQLRQENRGDLAQYATMAAQQVSRAADYLRGHDVNDMLGQAQDFARSQPAIFLAGAFALGLLGARFLKSSSPRQPARTRYPAANRYPSYQAPPGPYRGQYRGPADQGMRPGYSEYGGANGVARGGQPDARVTQQRNTGESDTRVPDARRSERR